MPSLAVDRSSVERTVFANKLATDSLNIDGQEGHRLPRYRGNTNMIAEIVGQPAYTARP